MKRSKRTITALLGVSSAFCLLGGVVALPTAAVTAETETSYGYNVQFQDDFNDGQLKEGWQYVSGAITANEGEGAVVWGDGTAADTGKMLYDTGVKEYVVSTDITLASYSANPFIYMPVAVSNAKVKNDGTLVTESNKIGQGVSVCFIQSAVKVWDFYSGSWMKCAETGAEFRFSYSNIPGYNDTWLTSAHEWKTVVGNTKIEIYVDGYYIGGVATPEDMQNATGSLLCGIGGANSGVVSYDNFTVWTKDEGNTETVSHYDFSNVMTEEEKTTYGVTMAAVAQGTKITFNGVTDSAGVTTGTQDFVHVANDKTYDDFTLTLDVNAMATAGIRTYAGVYFRATENTDGSISGYRLAFANGTNRKLYVYKTNTSETTTASPTAYTAIAGLSGLTYNTDYPVFLTVKGSSFTLSYTDADGVSQTKTGTDETYSEGYMGLRWSNKVKCTFSTTFTVAISTLSTEDTSALAKVTLNSAANEKFVYSLRNDGKITLDMLPSNAIAFVDADSNLYVEHNVSDGTEANVLTTTGFAMQNGATVRVTGTSGIRFKALVDADELNSLSEKGISVTECGTLIIPTAKFNGKLTVATANVGKGVATIDEVKEAGAYYATLIGIPEGDYATAISARGYLTLSFTVGEGDSATVVTRTVYTAYSEENNSRSIEEVAKAALADTEKTYTGTVLETLQKYAGVTAEE